MRSAIDAPLTGLERLNQRETFLDSAMASHVKGTKAAQDSEPFLLLSTHHSSNVKARERNSAIVAKPITSSTSHRRPANGAAYPAPVSKNHPYD